MGFLSRFSKPQAVDPVFGPIALDKHGWNGETKSPTGRGRVLVTVESGREGPSEDDRASFKALEANYPVLVSDLQSALFTLWKPSLAEPMWEESWPTTPTALWSMLKLSSLAIRTKGKVELLFAFEGEVWPDAMFLVEVQGKQVLPLSLDD